MGEEGHPPYMKHAAFVALLTGAIGLSLSSAAVQLLNGAVPELQLNLWRFLAQFLLTGVFCLIEQPDLLIPKEHWLNLAGIVLTMNVYNTCLYTAAKLLPLGTLEGMYLTFVICVNGFITALRKLKTSTIVISIVVCISGVVLLSQPEFMFVRAGLFRYPPTNYTSVCCDLMFSLEGNSTSASNAQQLPSTPLAGYILVLVASGSPHLLAKISQ